MIFFKEVALYLRKSRFDDESETLEEVLARHEKLLTEYCKRNNLIIKKVYREVVSGENIENRPQVQLDVNYEKGMGVSVGRIREDSVYDYKFVGLSHNTLRGAAGGAVLLAELLAAKGYMD